MDTIAAIATPPGSGGIGIIRLSGSKAKAILGSVFLPHSPRFRNFRPWTLHRGVLLDASAEPLDDVLAVYMPGPATYTGEDVVEIHCHGGRLIVEEALTAMLAFGARLAEPGEYTRRAYLNGRMDLSQAEAVAELINAPSHEALAAGLGRLEGRLSSEISALQAGLDEAIALGRVLVDFSEEEIDAAEQSRFAELAREIVAGLKNLLAGVSRARLMDHGASVVLAGQVNAGKSSLFNALLGRNRALVTDIPGTTRDILEERLDFSGLPVRLMDTAGMRLDGQAGVIEAMGIAAAKEEQAAADLAILVIDCRYPELDAAKRELLANFKGKILIAWNKADLLEEQFQQPDWADAYGNCVISAKTGWNLEELVNKVRSMLLETGDKEPALSQPTPNLRQTEALRQAKNELDALLDDLAAGMPLDCCLTRLDSARRFLERVISVAADDELLDMIFSKFCIGK